MKLCCSYDDCILLVLILTSSVVSVKGQVLLANAVLAQEMVEERNDVIGTLSNVVALIN